MRTFSSRGVLAAFISIISTLFFVSFFAAPAFAQSTPAICAVESTMSQGSTGDDVTTLQTFLAQQGDLSVSPTGFFGPLTEAALIQFQNATGITAQAGGNGIFGSFTRAYIAANFCTGSGSDTGLVSEPTPVLQNVSGELSVNPGSGVAPLIVTFTGIGSTISFGDGSSQTGQDGGALGTVSHTYTTPGSYVASSGGYSAHINVVSTNSSPGGSISAPNSSGPAPLSVTFYITCTGASAYDVTYGDGTDLGTNSSETKCDGSLQSVSHTYSANGTYTASLQLLVQQQNGTFATQSAGSVTITVGNGTDVSPSTTATLIAQPASGAAPLNVQFTGEAPYPYSINFGDGGSVYSSPVCDTGSCTSPQSISTSHTYEAIGTYYAVLSSAGTALSTSTITVTTTGVSDTCAAPSQDLQLGDTDADSSGQVSVLQNFLFDQGATIYPAQLVTGFFGNATLTGVRNFQAKYGIDQTGFVGPLTIAAIGDICKGTTPPQGTSSTFTASPTSGAAPLSVTVTATGFDTPPADENYAVDFGDGSTTAATASGSSYTDSHTYLSDGTFTATLYLEQDLCGSVSGFGFGCNSQLQEAQTTVTVSGGTVLTNPITTPTTPSGGFNTYYTFDGGYGANFNSTNPNDAGGVPWYCAAGTPAGEAGCGTPSPSATFAVFASQQTGTIPLYEMPSSGSCVASALSPYACTVVTPSSTASSVCPSGFAVGSSQCPVPNGAPGNLLGYVYPQQYAGTLPLYSVQNVCATTYFMTTSPSSAPQDSTGGCGVANIVVGVIGYIPLPTVPTSQSSSVPAPSSL